VSLCVCVCVCVCVCLRRVVNRNFIQVSSPLTRTPPTMFICMSNVLSSCLCVCVCVCMCVCGVSMLLCLWELRQATVAEGSSKTCAWALGAVVWPGASIADG